MTRRVIVAGLVLLLGGCAGTAPGRLYSNVTLPYSSDFSNTAIGSKRFVLDEYRLKEPLTGYGMTVEWSDNSIKSAAAAAGISKIAYMEQQTVSFVLGIYSRRSLIIYGD